MSAAGQDFSLEGPKSICVCCEAGESGSFTGEATGLIECANFNTGRGAYTFNTGAADDRDGAKGGR